MTKRVCELKKGELFLFMNCEFRVAKIADGRIYYVPYGHNASIHSKSFGENSQQKVEIIKTFSFKKTA